MPAASFRRQLAALGRPAPANGFWHERVSLAYAGGVLGSIGATTLAVLAIVEGVFLSETVISELLPRVLEYGGGFGDVAYLTALTIPSGLYLALPIAILFAVYLTLLRRREASEFTILAGMGHGARLLLGLSLAVGMLGFLVSSLLTDFVEPGARYELRRGFFEMAIEELRSGRIAAGKFHEFGDMTVFASRGRLGARATGIFVHQQIDAESNRMVMAERSLGLSSTVGQKAILLDNATVLNFALAPRAADCESCTAAPRLAPANVVNLNRFFVAAPDLPLPEAAPRGVGNSEELTTPELWARDHTRLLGQRLLRGMLCFVAPFLALAALGFTSQRSLLFALPAAAAVLLGGTFFGPRIVEWLDGAGTLATLAAVCAAGFVLCMAAIGLILWREPRCLGPARVRM